ncbi:MAG: VWA domain-containing protein, partial [Candidatus Nealsonbacteria bacterium]|nr:VWA domain-containing protein [Candidatus Nealsonbacteria bacterium]
KREIETLKGRLEAQDIGVTVQTSDQLFSSLAELQPYDSVVLANVPRVSGEGMDVYHFTDGQIQMLVRNTQQMGSGLVMLGGENSFGAGGWTGTELEKAMPVDFQIKSAKVEARGALVMLMHACEIPQGNSWEKKIAHEAIRVLGSQDYCGLLQWTGNDQWLWGKGLSPVAGNRQQMMAAVDKMTPSDMPSFDPAMRMALAGFRKVPQAAVKHMIIISDGDPSFVNKNKMIAAYRNDQITISTVAIGAHGAANSQLLKDIAAGTGGKYYNPQKSTALPRIFQREARRVARPLIWNKSPVRLAVDIPHEMIAELQGNMPPIGGFVMTDRKTNPLAEVHLYAQEAAGKENSTVLASWTYGAGRAVAFTSDTGNKWTTGWVGDVAYDKLFGTMIRWSMRPSGGADEFSIVSEVADGEVRMIINALDKKDNYINYLNMTGTAVGPDLKPMPMRVEQTAPGRYLATFPAGDAGSYFVAVNPGGGLPMVRTGVNVPYSDEFRDRQANDELLTELAAIRPEGGRAGVKIIAKGPGKSPKSLMWADTFRFEPGDLVKASSSQDVWQYVLMACCVLFFFDVFFRRVQVDLMWVPASIARAWGRMRGLEVETAPTAQIERLRSRKAAVGRKIEQLRTEARFEPTSQQVADVAELDKAPGPGVSGLKPADQTGPSIVPDQSTEEESYTERLLRAKKKAWKDKDN